MKQERINKTRKKIQRKILNKKVCLIQLLLKRVRYRSTRKSQEEIDQLGIRIELIREDIANLEANLVILTL